MNPNDILPNTLVDLLCQRADEKALDKAIIFDSFSVKGIDEITYQELDAKARAIAVWLQQHHAQGERVMLLFPAGIDNVASVSTVFLQYPLATLFPLTQISPISFSKHRFFVIGLIIAIV